MQSSNITTIILLGFQNIHNWKMLLSFLLLVIHCLTLCANTQIIFLVAVSKTLHRPMYFLLTQLSISDLLLTIDIIPIMLHTILNDGGIITIEGCLVQLYFFGLADTFDCLLLTVMSYDRYVAICEPLHYHLIMSQRKCIMLVISSWIYSAAIPTIIVELISSNILTFCGSNIIDHFFCDFEPLLQLSCSDLSTIRLFGAVLGSPSVLLSFFAIILSYVNILKTILMIPSQTGRHKAFSTCSAHITIVSIFFGTLIFLYIFPSKGRSLAWNKLLSIVYTIVTPLMNPVIYCLRNKDIKDAFEKLTHNLKHKYF